MKTIKILRSLWENKGKIAIGLMIMSIIFLAYLADSRAKTIKLREDEIIQWQADYKAQVEETQKATAAVARLAAERNKNDERLRAARLREREIRNVPKDQDGAVAPVMRDGFIRLRQQGSE